MIMQEIVELSTKNPKLHTLLLDAANVAIQNQCLKIQDIQIDKKILTEYNLYDDSSQKFISPILWEYYFLLSLQTSSKFDFSASPKVWLNALKKLISIRIDGIEISNAFWSVFVLYSNDFLDNKYIDQCRQISKHYSWEFCATLSKYMEQLNINTTQIYTLFTWLCEEGGDGYVYKVISEYAYYNCSDVILLIQLCESNNWRYEAIPVFCIQGLYRKKPTIGWRQTTLLLNNDSVPEFIQSWIINIVYALDPTENRFDYFFEKCNSFTLKQKVDNLSYFITNPTLIIKEKAAAELLKVVETIKTEVELTDVINKIGFINANSSKYLNSIFIAISKHNCLTQDSAQKLLSHLHGIEDVDLLFTLLQNISQHFHTIDFHSLRGCLMQVAKKDTKQYCEKLLQLVIHNRWKIRFTGRAIFDFHIVSYDAMDIFKLSDVEQIKLIASLSQDYVYSKERISLIVKLLDSPYSNVVDGVKVVLKQFIDNFCGGAIDDIKSVVVANKTDLNEIIEYYDLMCKLMELKRECKELLPIYTQGRLMAEYRRAESESFRELYSKIQPKKNSFFELFPRKLIAKGGGFRDARNQVVKLAHISTSTLLPMQSVVYGDLFDRYVSLNLTKDWD